MANIPFLLTLFSWLDYSKVGQTFYKSFDKIVTFKDPCGRQGGVVKGKKITILSCKVKDKVHFIMNKRFGVFTVTILVSILNKQKLYLIICDKKPRTF
jgi:hypothetical protein